MRWILIVCTLCVQACTQREPETHYDFIEAEQEAIDMMVNERRKYNAILRIRNNPHRKMWL